MCKSFGFCFQHNGNKKSHLECLFFSRFLFQLSSISPTFSPLPFHHVPVVVSFCFFFHPLPYTKLFNCKVHCNEAGPSNLREWVFIFSNVTLDFFYLHLSATIFRGFLSGFVLVNSSNYQNSNFPIIIVFCNCQFCNFLELLKFLN